MPGAGCVDRDFPERAEKHRVEKAHTFFMFFLNLLRLDMTNKVGLWRLMTGTVAVHAYIMWVTQEQNVSKHGYKLTCDSESISVPLVLVLSSVLNLFKNKTVTTVWVPHLYEQCLKSRLSSFPL